MSVIVKSVAEWRHPDPRPSSACPVRGPRVVFGTRKGRVACKACGSVAFGPYTVTHAVVPWRADNRYRLDQAISTHRTIDAADAAAVAAGPEYVGRTLVVSS